MDIVYGIGGSPMKIVLNWDPMNIFYCQIFKFHILHEY